jgi:hypothetical protein
MRGMKSERFKNKCNESKPNSNYILTEIKLIDNNEK